MNKTNKISKASSLLAESIKDNTVKNVLNYSINNKLSLNEKQLQGLMQLIDVSISEGHQIALRTFQKTVENILSEK